MSIRDNCTREADHDWLDTDEGGEDEEGEFTVVECTRCGRIRKEA